MKPRALSNAYLGYAQSLEKLDIKGFIARKNTLNKQLQWNQAQVVQDAVLDGAI
jgi:hypothetical protein